MKAEEHFLIDEVTQRLSYLCVKEDGLEFAKEVDSIIEELAIKHNTPPAKIAKILAHYTLTYSL